MLVLDTSTQMLTVAVVDGDRVLGEFASAEERNHSVRLLPAIEALMRSCGLQPRDLCAVASGCGPGSYTGVRIGVTVAKTFAWSLGLPLYAVSTLEALALSGWQAALQSPDRYAHKHRTSAWVVPALDGRRGQAYTALFAVDASGVWQRLQADAIVPFQMQLEQWIKKSEQPDIIVIAGEVEESLRPVIDAVTLAPQVSSSEDISRLIRQPVMVSARDIAAVARRHGSALRVQDVHELLPNYTQLAEAEAKWLAGQRAHE